MNEKRKLRLKYKIWLETDEKAFGEGPCDILTRVEKHGSLKGAAEEMGMSYSHAWKLVKKLEHQLGFKLLNFCRRCRWGGISDSSARDDETQYQALWKPVK